MNGERTGMRIKVTIQSDEITQDDLRALLQAVRDCEQRFFKEKRIWIRVDAPELSYTEMTGVLTSIRSPYDYGPVVIKRKENEEAG